MTQTIFAVDFDGTCVTHRFPEVGEEIGAPAVLKKLVDNGHKLILYTMRSDVVSPKSEDPNIVCLDGKYLTEAIKWFEKHDIELWGIQTNPTQSGWTTSPKCYAHHYIDDAAIGCPLVFPENDRPYVDWNAIENLLIIQGYL